MRVQSQPVAVAVVAHHGQKTRPNRTLKHYLQYVNNPQDTPENPPVPGDGDGDGDLPDDPSRNAQQGEDWIEGLEEETKLFRVINK
jgi:hypothetical protein